MAEMDTQGSVYVPLDNWIYPALDRLHALGYVDTAFLGLRPWTRISIAHMLELSADRIESDTNNEEARSIYAALVREFKPDIDRSVNGAASAAPNWRASTRRCAVSAARRCATAFTWARPIVDDYGRPYEGGFNNYSRIQRPAPRRAGSRSTFAGKRSTRLPQRAIPPRWQPIFPTPSTDIPFSYQPSCRTLSPKVRLRRQTTFG